MATFRIAAAVCAVGLLFHGSARQTHAQGANAKLADAVTRQLQIVAEELKRLGVEELRIGGFFGPADSSGSGRLKQEFRSRLSALGIKEASARTKGVELRGDFAIESVKEQRVVALKTRLVDSNGATIGNLADKLYEKISDKSDLVALLGTTFDASDAKSGPENSKAISSAVDTPKVEVTASESKPGKLSVVAPKPNSPFRIELFRKVAGSGKTSYEVVEATSEQGLAISKLKLGDVYLVRIHNQAKIDIAAKVFIDGVNSLHFSKDTDLKTADAYVIDKGAVGDLIGWHEEGNNFFEFVISEEPVAGKLGKSDDEIGTVTVQFFPAWPKDQEQPAEELTGINSRGSKAGSDKGDRVAGNTEQVDYNIGKTLMASVSIRYELAK